jgi:hypothetical protein
MRKYSYRLQNKNPGKIKSTLNLSLTTSSRVGGLLIDSKYRLRPNIIIDITLKRVKKMSLGGSKSRKSNGMSIAMKSMASTE